MDEMITYKFTLGIGLANARKEETVTVDDMGYTDIEWDDLTETEQEEILEETWKDWTSNFIDGGWELI